MRALLGLIRKEFIQVFRDMNMLRIIFVVPVIQLILFGYVVNTEVKNISLDVHDYDHSSLSMEFVDGFRAGNYFRPKLSNSSILAPDGPLQADESEMVLIIPEDFSEKVLKGEQAAVSLLADGTNANSAAIGIGYAARIARQFSLAHSGLQPNVEVRPRVLYNPEAESVYYMVPGIVATLLTMVTVMLTSMAIVRERERGTLEQLMVTPISKPLLLLGKILPFAILGFAQLTLVLTIGVLWFGIPFAGSPVLLYSLSLLYLLTTLGMGMFFSTVTSTQQQAMFFAWFFLVFAMLTSGFFTPVESMPRWLQYVTYINPMRFFMEIVRAIMMKGAGMIELLRPVIILAVYGATIFGFSALRFSKRVS